jgi:hypothetical protein
MKKLLRWALVLLVCYPAGCGVFVVASQLDEAITARQSEGLLTGLHGGMTPAEAEAVMGRPPEYTARYAIVRDDEQFSHNWTVRGYRVEVIFVNGRSAQWHTFKPDPGPVRRFFAWVFFWWLVPFVGD